MEKKFELKPCPFCGKIDFLQLDSKNIFYELQGEYGSAALQIRCKKCKLDMWDYSHHIRNYEMRKELLVEKWNRRADNNGTN